MLRRKFENETTQGRIIMWAKAGEADDEPALWRVRHEDGDEEDLEEEEVLDALELFESQPVPPPSLVTGADRLLK